MRRIYSIFLVSLFAATTLFASDVSVTVEPYNGEAQTTEDVNSSQLDDGKNGEIQRKSSYAIGTAPLPFQLVNNPHANIAVSTGYYLVDNDDNAPAYWRPNETIYSREQDPDEWVNVIAGPRIVDSNYWR